MSNTTPTTASPVSAPAAEAPYRESVKKAHEAFSKIFQALTELNLCYSEVFNAFSEISIENADNEVRLIDLREEIGRLRIELSAATTPSSSIFPATFRIEPVQIGNNAAPASVTRERTLRERIDASLASPWCMAYKTRNSSCRQRRMYFNRVVKMHLLEGMTYAGISKSLGRAVSASTVSDWCRAYMDHFPKLAGSIGD